MSNLRCLRKKYKVNFWKDIFSDLRRRKQFHKMKRIHKEIEAMYPFLKDPDPVIRLGAVGYASALEGGPEVLANLLSDKDARVRERVTGIIGATGDVRYLLDVLWDKEMKIRQRATNYIGMRGSWSILPVLVLKLVDTAKVRKGAWYWLKRRSIGGIATCQN